MTCGFSLLLGLARVRCCDLLTKGLPLKLSGEGPVVISVSTAAMGDGISLRKAEWRVPTGDTKEDGLLDVLAAASASSSTGDDATSKGEEGCCLMTGSPLTVTFRRWSGQGLDRKPCQ